MARRQLDKNLAEKRFTIRLPEWLFDQCESRAMILGCSINRYLNAALIAVVSDSGNKSLHAAHAAAIPGIIGSLKQQIEAQQDAISQLEAMLSKPEEH